MSLKGLEKLMYQIGVIDKVTGPVNKIMGKMNALKEQAQSAQQQVTGGMMSAAGGAMMLVGSLNPAIEAQAAMGEVQSLGVSNEAIQTLNNTAMNFTSNYGGNSADVIRSSYDIQSAISGLTGKELAQFTESAALLAKGTKSDASVATDYFGTMHGIYQNTANLMGKNEWIKQLTGQTALSVRMFKTTGSEMASAFSSLGASANSHGIEMNESMAILGQLQATMSGSEAGTKYQSFLNGVAKAQKTLGIEMTDSTGRMLPMVDILNNIHHVFGDIDTVAKADVLKKAFGRNEAVDMLKLLLPQTAQLKTNIEALADVKDMGIAIEMADSMGSAWERLTGSTNAAFTALGLAVLPIIDPIFDAIAKLLQGVVWLTQTFPTLSGIIAAGVVAMVTFTVAMGAFNVIMGLYRMTMLSSIIFTKAHLLITKLWQAALVALRVIGFLSLITAIGAATIAIGAYNGIMFVSKMLTKLWQGALVALRVIGFLSLITAIGTATIAIGAYNGIMAAARTATLLFNSALWANPITWIVVGVMALIAAVAALIYYWQDLINAFSNTTWGELLFKAFDGVKAAFDSMIGSVKWLLESLGLIDNTEAKIKTQVEHTGKSVAQLTQPEQIANLRTHAVLNQTRLNTQFNNVHALQPMQQNQQQNQHFATNVIPFNSQQINKSLSTQTIQNEQLTKLANTHVTHSAINQATNTGLNQTRLNTQLNNVHALQPMQHYQHKQQNQHFTNNVIPLNTQTTNSATRMQTVQNTAVNQAINPVSNVHAQQNEQLTKLAYLNQDHALTNNLSTTNTEHTNQNATSSYTATAKKSPFLQSLAKNYSVNTSNSNADNSKNVHIEHVTVKTDDLAKTFEDMMELAG